MQADIHVKMEPTLQTGDNYFLGLHNAQVRKKVSCNIT